MPDLPEDRMPEAEVALRFAFWLLERPGETGGVVVSVDGAGVRVGGREIFPLRGFMEALGWAPDSPDPGLWRTVYRRDGRSIEVNSRPGVGDVVGTVGVERGRPQGRRVRAECKKGPLIPRRGSPEMPLLREALAQLLTVEEVRPDDVLVAAVPDTPAYRRLAAAWSGRPLVRRANLRVALVGRDGNVRGLDDL